MGARLVGGTVRKTLRKRIAPAGVAPHFGLGAQALHLAIERLDVDVECDFLVDAYAAVKTRLLDLKDLAPGVSEPMIFLVERLGESEDRLLAILVEPVLGLALDHLAAATAELNRPVGQLLRDFPDRGILQASSPDRPYNLRRAQCLDELSENVARLRGARAKRRARRPERGRIVRHVRFQPAHAIEQVAEPGAAADIGIKTHLAVGDDVEPRARLIRNHGGCRVDILLEKGGIAIERGEEGAVTEVLHVPAGPRKRAGDGGRQRAGGGRYEHGGSPDLRMAFQTSAI